MVRRLALLGPVPRFYVAIRAVADDHPKLCAVEGQPPRRSTSVSRAGLVVRSARLRLLVAKIGRLQSHRYIIFSHLSLCLPLVRLIVVIKFLGFGHVVYQCHVCFEHVASKLSWRLCIRILLHVAILLRCHVLIPPWTIPYEVTSFSRLSGRVFALSHANATCCLVSRN